MSRSYKHTPKAGQMNCKFAKRIANKVVRRAKHIYPYKAYKKLYCSYNICDYKSVYVTYFDFCHTRWGWETKPSRNQYEKYYLRK